MDKILITGGSGTIGKAFIKRYYGKYKFYNISRNENSQTYLKREFPCVTNFIGAIEDTSFICNTFEKVKPDIVIHMAAMKHIDIIEDHPIQGCIVNILGSLNVITASIRVDVPVTIGISTDKACSAESNYGHTKFLMEKCFMEAYTERNKFALCRFANVAHSSCSVIPLWQKMKAEGKPLRLTDTRMNRLMFSQKASAEFIHRTMELCKETTVPFIGINSGMKVINMYELAKCISGDIDVVGKLTEAEKFDEDLISDKEVPYTYMIDENYVMIRQEKNVLADKKMIERYGSHNAEKMDINEIKELIANGA